MLGGSGPSLTSPSLAHRLRFSPAAPAFPVPTCPGRLRIHPSSWGGGESDGTGLGRCRLLSLVELQRGDPWEGGPAGFGVPPSSKDAPKPLSVSRCVNMANLFYSFSVHYTQRYIYIYTYILLYIDTYRYIYIYYL